MKVLMVSLGIDPSLMDQTEPDVDQLAWQSRESGHDLESACDGSINRNDEGSWW